MDTAKFKHTGRRRKTKARGTHLRTCTTLQPSHYYGDANFLRGVNQVCRRASSIAKDRLRALKRLEGVYNPQDLKPLNQDLNQKNKSTPRTIYSMLRQVSKGPGLVFKQIFEKYADSGGLLHPNELRVFLREVQGISLDECVEVQADHFDDDFVHCETILTAMLENDALHGAIDYDQVQDMTKPLTYYWINSSHNTYLSGRQIGPKTADAAQYTRVLERGCRCVEIDVWESGSQLKVRHRYMTNALDLKPVLNLIRKAAFKTSPYPVILSIEQHLSGKSLKKMMQCIKECFKGLLLEDRLKPLEKPVNLSLMSPEDLRNCILIKMRGKDDIQADFSVAKLHPKKNQTSANAGVNKAITSGNEIISLAESFAKSMIGLDADESRRRTRTHLARVYPSSMRIDSSNYSPVKIWIAGCQMAALNLQKPGSSVLLNQALFNLNKRRGYVLKPEVVLSGGIPKIPVERLSITILSGHRFFVLPQGACKKTHFECQLRATIAGTAGDQGSQELDRMLTLSHDFEINTVFEFELCLPEAAFLKISLRSAAIIGSFTAVVSSLRRGIRFLHLTDLLGEKASPSCCLLAYIERSSLRNEE